MKESLGKVGDDYIERESMIHIGKSYILHTNCKSRLCADITINDHKNTLWFSVDDKYEKYLAVGRADAFVMAFIATAMRGNHEIICEDEMSERLHWQLKEIVIPSLSFAGERYHMINISAPLTVKNLPNYGATGTGFSGGVDSLYTVMQHGKDAEYPLTHIVVYNSSHYDIFGAKRECRFLAGCKYAESFGKAYGLNVVTVDTNFNEVLGMESRLDVYSFRNMACTLALQGLFSVYLLSSGRDYANFQFDIHNSASYDALTVPCVSTEGLTFYLSGGEAKRWQKMQNLSLWEPAKEWLHPCFFAAPGKRNCGHCIKCICDLVTLYALGGIDLLYTFSQIYDIPDFLRHLSARIGYVIAITGSVVWAADGVWKLVQEMGREIPVGTYIYAEKFKRIIEQKKRG